MGKALAMHSSDPTVNLVHMSYLILAGGAVPQRAVAVSKFHPQVGKLVISTLHVLSLQGKLAPRTAAKQAGLPLHPLDACQAAAFCLQGRPSTTIGWQGTKPRA